MDSSGIRKTEKAARWWRDNSDGVGANVVWRGGNGDTEEAERWWRDSSGGGDETTETVEAVARRQQRRQQT